MDSKKPKILIFSTAYIPFIGGAEIAVKEITNRLIDDFEFDLITLNLDSKQKKLEMIGAVTVHRIGSGGELSKLLFPFQAFKKAKELHTKNQYDLIWSIMASYSGFAARFFKKKFQNVPFVLTLQEGDPIPEIKRKVRLVYSRFKEIFTLANKIQAISNYLADWARDMGAKGEITVVPNGVDVERFKIPACQRLMPQAMAGRQDSGFKNQEEIVLITTSRLVEKNGVEDVIDAMEFLPENVKFKILGIGPLEKVLKFKVKSLKLEDRVEFLGFVSQAEIPAHLHKADIFIRPSLSEGMGNSFIEAMAAGLPCVATPVGGIVDFIRDPSNSSGQAATGIFCQVNNPQSIADAVMKLVKNPELYSKIKEQGFEMVKEKYDWEIIATEMKNIFSEIPNKQFTNNYYNV